MDTIKPLPFVYVGSSKQTKKSGCKVKAAYVALTTTQTKKLYQLTWISQRDGLLQRLVFHPVAHSLLIVRGHTDDKDSRKREEKVTLVAWAIEIII